MNAHPQLSNQERPSRVLNGWLILPIHIVALSTCVVLFMILDDERKAAMVSNLMIVLCGEAEVHPVINTGSLYT